MGVLKCNFSAESTQELIGCMKEVVYGPEEIIFHKDEFDDRIFFINEGSI